MNTVINYAPFLSAIAALLAAVAASGAWVCTIIASFNTHKKLNDIHVLINSRMSQLIASTMAEGKAVGIEQERGRSDKEK